MKPLSGRWNKPSDKLQRISIIIPTFNEAMMITDCLNQFESFSERVTENLRPGILRRSNKTCEPAEVIVVDGGSNDDTAKIVKSYSRVRYIEHEQRGRAVQMNAGAAAALGDVLLFLHADTKLPYRWSKHVIESIYHRGMSGGRFRFDIADPKRIYRWIARGTNFRSRILGITYGDQAIYARRETFETLGGYPKISVFEDAGFAERLKKVGGLDWIDEPILTSARRWEKRGPIRTLLLTWLLRTLYTFYVPPRFLARFYSASR